MILKDKTLEPVEFSSFVSEGLSLCLHAPSWFNDWWFRTYTNELLPYVDRVICISALNQMILPACTVYHPDMIALYDENKQWISSLGHEEPIELLCDQLKCHQLWKDGEVIGYWYLPLTDPWKNFKKWLSKQDVEAWIKEKYPDRGDRKYILSQLQLKDDSIFFMGARNKIFSHKYTKQIHKLQWYSLVPNKELESILGCNIEDNFDY